MTTSSCRSARSAKICVGARDPAQIAERFRLDWELEAEGEMPAYVPMLGYWNKAERSKELMLGGVMHTGDAGSLDSKGIWSCPTVSTSS